MNVIGVIKLRLHGFHRFLPHLWELFFCARFPGCRGPLQVSGERQKSTGDGHPSPKSFFSDNRSKASDT
jgi:hypothetical protein